MRLGAKAMRLQYMVDTTEESAREPMSSVRLTEMTRFAPGKRSTSRLRKTVINATTSPWRVRNCQ